MTTKPQATASCPEVVAAQDAQAPGVAMRQVLRHANGRFEQATDAIATEVPVAFAFNGQPFAVMMATPEDLEDFAIGFPLAEGLVASTDVLQVDAIDTHLEGVAIALRIPDEAARRIAGRRRAMEGRSGCGICGSESIEAVLAPPPRIPEGRAIAPEAITRALQALQARQPLNARTGATHAAAFVTAGGDLALVREDVGRHNALDKLVGALHRVGMDPASGFALVTSRASYEMVMKAARAGFPLLAAISAPTALAVVLADHAGMTLVGFARGDGHVVYAHPDRLAAPAT